MGVAEVPVRRRAPRVAVLTTGDEVMSTGRRPLKPGKIYDCNQSLLAATY